MIDTVLFGFDVAIQHGAIRFQPEPMGRARNVQPLPAIDLVIANDAADAVAENFGSAAGKRIDACVHQAQQRFTDGDPGSLREVADLNHGESFKVYVGKSLLEAA